MADPELDGGATEAPAPAATAPDGGQQAPGAADTTVPAAATPPSTEAGSTAEETFFDPRDLDPALMPAYKQMQADYTRKTQGAREHREKIAAYDSFVADPHAAMRTMAERYGYTLAQANAAAGAGAQPEDWQPQSWDDVLSRAEEQARTKVMSELQPLLSEVRNQRRESIERTLDDTVPDWRQYEDEMGGLLRQHPSLVNDPAMLAKLAIPEQVQKGRAMQEALRKMEAKAEAARATGGSQTTTDPTEQSIAGKKLTFRESVDLARKQVAAAKG